MEAYNVSWCGQGTLMDSVRIGAPGLQFLLS